jgi:hypothetical protein
MKYNTLYPIVLNNYKNKVFVETGLWQGHGIQVALDCGFDQIFSCDIHPVAIDIGKKLFGNNPKVEIHDVDSVQFLENFFQTHNITEGITFWLDAHGATDANIDAPLVKELSVIKKYCHNKNIIIMIDDYHSLERWAKNLSREDISNILMEINPNFKINTQKRIYSLSLDINEENLPTKGEILVAKL